MPHRDPLIRRRSFLAGALALSAFDARAEDVAALLQPGVHAVMRHALAPGTGDPADFRLGDPATQRLLSDEGRAQAARIGRALRAAGVRFDAVFSSRWERCLETAALMEMGEVRPEPALDSFFEARARGPAQTAQTRALLAGLAPEAQALLVTHQVNVTALTGVYPASGEVVAIRLDRAAGAEGDLRVVARLRL